VHLNGQPITASADEPAASGFFPISREWHDGDVVTVTFPITLRVTHWYHNSVAFEAGPLVFSLPLNGEWTRVKKYAEKSADWEVRPTRAWNYAVELGQCSAELREGPLSNVPFDTSAPAVSIEVRGREVVEWTMTDNSAGPLPLSPVSSRKPEQKLTLVPYGAAKVRVTVFPYLDETSQCASGRPVS
jgi:hypothetical protein